MSTNHYRRNYSAGMSAPAASRQMATAPRLMATASRPMGMGPARSRGNAVGTQYTSRATSRALASNTTVSRALVPQAPASGTSFPAASFPPPGNVVELYPAAGTRRMRRSVGLLGSEAGMATAEYAIATLAAVGFAGLLVFILRSDEVRGFLLNLIRTALALP
ncbi:hypothetical protein J2T22_001483 [Pseudarthrobacter defluvii]|uniref:DUF4244 domain-containing protein n=1 Tax=Pseudarthrobacter defluvii TaxID=410837 RepID=A0ABT9UF95_9MICC|nr:DUF4244 domain-containing protein [Pseudarthrobacter defluvii]MDQ0118306.1 hypothetical protein [Pseudarthrobacter defluvii]